VRLNWGEFYNQVAELYLGSVPTAAQLAVFAKRCGDSILALLVAFALVRLGYLVIRLGVGGARRAAARIGRVPQMATVEALFRSICKYAIYIVAVIAILRIWQVDTRSLIVGSAIVGGAIGFGAQGLIQDIITGLSLLFESQLAVGDWVEIGGKAGVVEEVGLRAVKIRDALGQRHIIFNRSISLVSNYTARAVALHVDLVVPEGDRAEQLRSRLEEMSETLGRDRSRFVGPLEIKLVGQTELGETRFRLEGRIIPFQQADVQAQLERAVKRITRTLEIDLPPENLTISFAAAPFDARASTLHPSR